MLVGFESSPVILPGFESNHGQFRKSFANFFSHYRLGLTGKMCLCGALQVFNLEKIAGLTPVALAYSVKNRDMKSSLFQRALCVSACCCAIDEMSQKSTAKGPVGYATSRRDVASTNED